MPVVDPNHHPAPAFPDPKLIDALAQKWLAEAEGLYYLAEVIHEVVSGTDWTGVAYEAAATAAAKVQQVVQASGDNAYKFGQELQQYADAVRKAIKEAKAEFWASIFGAVFMVVSFGVGYLLAAIITPVAQFLEGLGVSIEAAAFTARALSSFLF